MRMNAKDFMTELYKSVPSDKVTYLFTRPDDATYPYTIGRMDQMLEKAMQLTKNAAFVYKFVDCHELFVINQRFPYSSGLCYGVDYGLPWFER